MAAVMPFVGWGVYRLIAGSSPVQSPRHWIGGAVGGYVGLCVAALLTGIEFGLQPLLAHDAAGRALYCPFGLHLAVPAMALEHLLVFGFVEGIVTGLVVASLQRTAPDLIVPTTKSAAARTTSALVPWLALALGVLVLLSPLGLYLPDKLKAGSAWGEWSSEEIQAEMAQESGRHERYVPEGLQRVEESGWKAPLPDYALPGQESAPLSALSLSYILSGAIGVVVLGVLILLGHKIFARKDDADVPSSVDARPSPPGGQ
jgi:cobalt/nickel transport system permease protein